MRSFLIQTLEVQSGCLKSTLVSRFHFARFPVFLKLSNFFVKYSTMLKPKQASLVILKFFRYG